MHDGYMMNWQKCKCTTEQTASGNGCVYCNPEQAYFIAIEQANKARENEHEREKQKYITESDKSGH